MCLIKRTSLGGGVICAECDPCCECVVCLGVERDECGPDCYCLASKGGTMGTVADGLAQMGPGRAAS